MPDFSPAQPWRAETRLIPCKAAASEEARRYNRTSCGPFALAMDLEERKNPSSASDLRKSLQCVELLSEARAPLANFFIILLGLFLVC